MPTTRSQTAQDLANSNASARAALYPISQSKLITEGLEDLPECSASAMRSGIVDDHTANNARLRQAASSQFLTNDTSYRPQPTKSDEPPRFMIDLSLPPEQRYVDVCAALQTEIAGLTSLFDEVVGGMVKFLPLKWLHLICRLLLRGIYDKEENAELKGISKATGVSIYLLVCFNVLLDLFMGCSSGGAAVKSEDGGSKMLHFRTLDWGMPALRRVIVHLDFVAEAGGPVVASSITYAGFVGVLTGVRKGFSVSLNFRPNHNDSGKFWADAKYAWHLVLVLLGWRPSISSTLRDFLLPASKPKGGLSAASYLPIVRAFTDSDHVFVSTACYLCFSNGQETTVVEKDRITAKVRSSGDFIVVTNNDEIDPVETDTKTAKQESIFAAALAEIVDEAKDRKQCAEHNWNNMRVAKAKALGLRNPERSSSDPTRDSGKISRVQGTRSWMATRGQYACTTASSPDELNALLGVDDVVTMVQKYPTTNETTHFACVMDPIEGTVRWCRRWMRPVTAKWIREHQSETW